MEDNMEDQKKWNKEVNTKVDELLIPLIEWVEKKIVKDKEGWFDEFTGSRAKFYLELAKYEIYNDMYYESPEEREQDLRNMQIQS